MMASCRRSSLPYRIPTKRTQVSLVHRGDHERGEQPDLDEMLVFQSRGVGQHDHLGHVDAVHHLASALKVLDHGDVLRPAVSNNYREHTER